MVNGMISSIRGGLSERHRKLMIIIACPVLWLAIMWLALYRRDTSPAGIIIIKDVLARPATADAAFDSYARYAAIYRYPIMTMHHEDTTHRSQDRAAERSSPASLRNVAIMQHLISALESRTSAWILWAGSDSFVTNYDLRLESLIPTDKMDGLPNILVAARTGDLSLDLMLIKVDYWSFAFFARATAVPYYESLGSDESLCHLLRQHEDVRERVSFIERDLWSGRLASEHPGFELSTSRGVSVEAVKEASDAAYRRYYTAMTHPSTTSADRRVSEGVQTWWAGRDKRNNAWKQICGE